MKKRIFIIAFILLIIDMITKIIVTSNMTVGSSINVISGFFSITYVENTGAAWGMFSNGTVLLGLLSVVFLIVFTKYILDQKLISLFNSINYALIIAGVFGNMIDRFARGFVVDFLNFQIFSYDFPVFNVADIFIVVGIILVAIDYLLVGGKNDSRRG
ncbi:MAG: signal peptidase II [Bacilli bacterium]|nr:signal peptidase II [Bacilli bacterium]